MSSKQTTRSGRSVKPTKRMIEEPELDSSLVSKSSQEFNVKQETTNTRSKYQVKEIQSNMNSRSGRSIKPTKRWIEELDNSPSTSSKSSQESKVKKKITNTKGKCQVTRRTTKEDEEFGLCFVNAIVAVIAGVTVLISSGLLLYYSVYDYMYSPAPIKPMTTLEKLVGITLQPLLSISKWMTENDLF